MFKKLKHITTQSASYKACLFFVFTIAILSVSIAETKNDSLLNSIKKCNTEECRIDIKLKLIEVNLYDDSKKALEISYELLSNKSIDLFTDKKAKLYRYIGVIYRNKTEIDSTTKYIDKALNLYEKSNDKNNIAILYNDLGSVYAGLGAYNVSLHYFFKALKICEENDTLQSLPLIYNSIGNSYAFLKQYNTSMLYYRKALLINKDELLNATMYSNIAINYSEKAVYDSAIYFFRKSSTIYENFGDKYGVENNYISYANAFALSGHYDSAHFYIDQAIQYFKETDNEWILGYCYDIKGSTFRLEKNFSNAKPYLTNAINILDKYQDNWALKETYLNMYKLENDMGNSKAALDYYIKYNTLNDSISNAEIKTEVYHLDKTYETEKKEAQILLLNKENEIKAAKIKRNTILLVSFSLLALLFLSLAIVLKRNNNFKTETNLLLQEKNEQLRTLNATKDKLFSIVAHDLKNPLSAFRNITGSLKNQYANLSKDDIEEFIGDLYDSSSKLMDLLQNLLKWAISQTNNITVEIEEQTIFPIIHRVIDSVQYNAEEKMITIANNVDENLIVNVDENIIETILRNFVSNAIKFTPKNGTIRIYNQQAGNKIQIRVSDTGIGIKNEDQKKLFSINENVAQIGNSSEKGTGLGLILCKELIEKMHGKIGVESEENKGSTFYIEF